MRSRAAISFVALVGRAGLAGEETDVGAQDLHVEIAVGDRHVELVEIAPAEGIEGAGEGDVALLREPCRHAHEVLLGDAGLHQLGGVIVLEDVEARGAAEVGIEGDDLRVLAGQVGQDVPGLVTHLPVRVAVSRCGGRGMHPRSPR